MTTLIDIYEASGYEVNEDRTMVAMGRPKPIQIVLNALLTEHDLGMHDWSETVTFDVLLKGDYTLKDGGAFVENDYATSLRLPVNQVNILDEKVIETPVIRGLFLAERALEAERNNHWQWHLTEHPNTDGVTDPRCYAMHDAYAMSIKVVQRLKETV